MAEQGGAIGDGEEGDVDFTFYEEFAIIPACYILWVAIQTFPNTHNSLQYFSMISILMVVSFVLEEQKHQFESGALLDGDMEEFYNDNDNHDDDNDDDDDDARIKRDNSGNDNNDNGNNDASISFIKKIAIKKVMQRIKQSTIFRGVVLYYYHRVVYPFCMYNCLLPITKMTMVIGYLISPAVYGWMPFLYFHLYAIGGTVFKEILVNVWFLYRFRLFRRHRPWNRNNNIFFSSHNATIVRLA